MAKSRNTFTVNRKLDVGSASVDDHVSTWVGRSCSKPQRRQATTKMRHRAITRLVHKDLDQCVEQIAAVI